MCRRAWRAPRSSSVFRRDSWDAGSTSETYGPGTLPDRSSLGIESETTQSGIGLRHPAGSALLTRGSRLRVGRANPTNSGLFRRVRDLLETTHCMQTAARRTSVQPDNFRDALLPLATAACVYDHEHRCAVSTASAAPRRLHRRLRSRISWTAIPASHRTSTIGQY